MSHGAGLIRTTCSSGGGALGPGAGAAQPGASPLEGLLDPGYPRTHAALLKVAQMVTLLIAFICVRSSVWTDYSAYSYFEVVTICDLIMILAFYLVHLFRFYRVLTCISWPLSIFGFVATFLCMASMWLSYKVSCVTQSTEVGVKPAECGLCPWPAVLTAISFPRCSHLTEATAPRPLRSFAERRTCTPGEASGPVFLCQSPARLVGTRKGLHPLPAFPGSQLPEHLSQQETLSPAFRLPGEHSSLLGKESASREFCFRPSCF
ncbi:CKLF-like MARVEL transmembrane domain-containing protein 7 isoform X2 [Callithrix jacchus]|uniref:CKLF-like MARVEL transmembrane domain-containing protein 7 isoform X2 n=1 Tax=Callithrix jacchus TaxID=9483 RepID=UPI0023DD1F57|nr:CKLF-like MARVEL transmembrane domain-containing protein 7 isoform X2 [Callithrix jacchus]